MWLDLRLPDFMSEITRLIQTEGSKISEILLQGGYMLLCALGSLISAIIVGYLTSNLSAAFSYTLRKSIFEKVSKLGMKEIKKFKTSSLITRTTNDVTQIEMFLAMGLQMLIKAPIMTVWAVSKILNKSTELSLLTGSGVVILLITIGIIMMIVFPRFEKIQKLIDNLNDVTRENLTGIRVIRAFNAEGFEQKRFDNVNTNLTNMQMFNQKCFAILNPVMNLVMHGLTLGIYIIGAILIEKAMMLDKINLFSNVVVFTSYGMQVIAAFLMLAFIFMILPRASVSARRINEVLDSGISIKEGNFSSATEDKGVIEFKNVSFAYENKRVLNDVSFKIKKNSSTALVGESGSGKSTIIKLIMGLIKYKEGNVLIDKKELSALNLNSYYDKVIYVSQEAPIFDGTLRENLVFDKKVSDEEIVKVLNLVCLDKFYETSENKLETELGEKGIRMSGGERQRVALARLFFDNSKIVILDEATSQMDNITEKIVMKNILEKLKDKTLIIIAHRLETIKDVDNIFVLKNGEIIEEGKYEELLKNDGYFKKLYKSVK